MDAESKQILREIEEKRERLGDNLSELETRVRDAADWRTYFARYPWLMMGAATAGGWLLSSLIIPRHRTIYGGDA